MALSQHKDVADELNPLVKEQSSTKELSAPDPMAIGDTPDTPSDFHLNPRSPPENLGAGDYGKVPVPVPLRDNLKTGIIVTSGEQAQSPSTTTSEPTTIPSTSCEQEKQEPSNDQGSATNLPPLQQSSETQPSCEEPMKIESVSEAAKREPDSTSPARASIMDPVLILGSSAEPTTTLASSTEEASTPALRSEHETSNATVSFPSMPKEVPVISMGSATDLPPVPSAVTVELPGKSECPPSPPPVEPTVDIPVQATSDEVLSTVPAPIPVSISSAISNKTPIQIPSISEPKVNILLSSSSQSPPQSPPHVDVLALAPVKAPSPEPAYVSNTTEPVSPAGAPSQLPVTSQTSVDTKVPALVQDPTAIITHAQVSPTLVPALATSETHSTVQVPTESLPKLGDLSKKSILDNATEAPMETAKECEVDSATTSVAEQIVTPAPMETVKDSEVDSETTTVPEQITSVPMETVKDSDIDSGTTLGPEQIITSVAMETIKDSNVDSVTTLLTEQITTPAPMETVKDSEIDSVATSVKEKIAKPASIEPVKEGEINSVITSLQEEIPPPVPMETVKNSEIDSVTTLVPEQITTPAPMETVKDSAINSVIPLVQEKISPPAPIKTVKESEVNSMLTSVQEQNTLRIEPPKQQEVIDGVSVSLEGGSDICGEPQQLKTISLIGKPGSNGAQESQGPKLPPDAPPSMDDDSLETLKEVDGRPVANHGEVAPSTEEIMDTEGPLDVPVVACSSEDNSKDAPPQDFKPFSNYTEDGKLIANGEGKSADMVAPTILGTTPTSDPAASSVEPMSVDDSFPGASDSVKSHQMSIPTSQFQNQFMDFLKCNDNATQHSFTDGAVNSGENSTTGDGVMKLTAGPTQGETMIGREVTADGEVTMGSQIPDEGSQSCSAGMEETSQTAPSTPRTGKKRGRRKKCEIEAQRLADAAVAGEEMPKPARTLRKRKPKDAEKTKEDEDEMDDDKTSPKSGAGVRKKATSPGLVPSTFPAEKLFEYQWPQNKAADWFFLQEHLSSFLGVKSFKRKYPDLTRRTVGMPERNFLQESGVVSEMQCDLGLTSLKSDQVYELLLKDFPDKYKQYAQVLREREHVRVAERKRLASEMAKMNKNDLGDVVKRAVRSAAEFNAQFMREKREERRAYFDLQTNEIHYPQSTRKVLPPETTKVGAYPVSLIPGQFQEHFKKYTPAQMKYFPLSTAIYDPPKHLDTIYADPNDKYESEIESQSASSQGEEDDGSSSSGSSSGSGSDGDSDSSSDAPEPEVVTTPAPPTTKKPGRPPRGKKFVVRPIGAAVVKDTGSICNICQGSSEKNKIGESEELVKCAECGRHGHPSCLELTEEMIPNIKMYSWQCMECKTCVECMDPYDEDKMMFCDHCDRGYHTFCVGLRSIPTGRWECPSCRSEPATKKRRRQQNTT